MKTFLISIFLTTISVLPAFPQPEYEEYRLAVNNLIEDHVSCYAFYKISEEGLRKSNMAETANIYQSSADTFFERAIMLAGIIEMKNETILAKVQLRLEDMLEDMDYDNINFSILLAKYSKPCKHLGDNLEEVMEEKGLLP